MSQLVPDSKVIDTLRAFIQCELDASVLPDSSLSFEPITGDAGFRQYFRINTRVPMLAVWAPTDTEDSAQFCSVAGYLVTHGVRAPRVVAADASRGLLLIEDFGDTLLQGELNESTVDGYYSEAMTMLLHMQSSVPSGQDTDLLPSYDEPLLLKEMSLFDEWYLENLLGLTLSAKERTMLDTLYSMLIERAAHQAQVVVHRDFHSRNLLVLDDGALATIDFQDAVIGPVTYDLVSLLKDCYVVWDDENVRRWALSYASLADAAGIITVSSERAFLKDFDFMGLQRHIKVLGIFARLHLRDGKSRYLGDLPTVLNYVIQVSVRYPELSELLHFIRSRIEPALFKMVEYEAQASLHHAGQTRD